MREPSDSRSKLSVLPSFFLIKAGNPYLFFIMTGHKLQKSLPQRVMSSLTSKPNYPLLPEIKACRNCCYFLIGLCHFLCSMIKLCLLPPPVTIQLHLIRRIHVCESKPQKRVLFCINTSTCRHTSLFQIFPSRGCIMKHGSPVLLHQTLQIFFCFLQIRKIFPPLSFSFPAFIPLSVQIPKKTPQYRHHGRNTCHQQPCPEKACTTSIFRLQASGKQCRKQNRKDHGHGRTNCQKQRLPALCQFFLGQFQLKLPTCYRPLLPALHNQSICFPQIPVPELLSPASLQCRSLFFKQRNPQCAKIRKTEKKSFQIQNGKSKKPYRFPTLQNFSPLQQHSFPVNPASTSILTAFCSRTYLCLQSLLCLLQ